MTDPASVLPALERIVTDVIAPFAVELDRTAAFPTAAIRALGEAGLLGLLIPEANGGMGLGPDTAALVVERIAQVCGSTAMVVCMHYAGSAVLAAHGAEAVQRDVAAGRHLSTLAFSEAGSRSHFWAPLSTATSDGEDVHLTAQKSWVTSASHADAYVWSSKPMADEGFSTTWLVPRGVPGLSASGGFDGIGLRGNDSLPVRADGVRIPIANRLGADGKGFDVMMGVVLPVFNLLSAAVSIGLSRGALERTCAHAGGTRHEHAGTSLADLPTIRAHIARMQIRVDMTRTLWLDTMAAMGAGRPDTMLRVLEVKAAAAETALEVTATAMRVCGGAAFRKDVGVDRAFRDAQAASVMGPTTDVLWDFIGKAVTGLPLF